MMEAGIANRCFRLFRSAVAGSVCFAVAAAVFALRPVPTSEPVRLYGADYVSLAETARRFGWTTEWREPARTLVLTGDGSTWEFSADARESRFDGIRMFLGEAPVTFRNGLWFGRSDRDTLFAPVVRPGLDQLLLPRLERVMLDPGHGGRDTGARNSENGLEEKELTLDLAHRLRRHLEAMGLTVFQTRADDRFVGLGDRAEYANRNFVDLFISLHFNAAENPAARGIETYVLSPQGQRSTGRDVRMPEDEADQAGNRFDHWNAVAGFQLHRRMLRDLDAPDRGLKRARFRVLTTLECPGVLVEGGYLSNSEEVRLIADPEYRERLAASIAAGVAEYGELLRRLQKERASAHDGSAANH